MPYKIKNWSLFQHYKQRNPPWIKLHFGMLSSQDWVMMDDQSRVLAIACMLIASRNGGKIPDDLDYIKRVAYLKTKPNLKPLIECGFVEPDGDCKQMLADASTSIYTEERRGETETDSGFDAFYQAYPKKVGKDDARKAWNKKKPPLADVLKAIEQYKLTPQWNKDDGQFIPNPSTWLNQGRWKDEIFVVENKIKLKNLGDI